MTGPAGRSSFSPLAGYKWPRCGLALTGEPSGGRTFAFLSLSHSTTSGLYNRNSVNVVVIWLLEVSIIEQEMYIYKKGNALHNY